jgi:dTDP-4-amino-4,6-dideoxygalactose transaminase
VRTGREYGNDGNYDSFFPGINARLPEMSALIARYSLGRLEEAAERRNEIAGIYRQRLGCLPGLDFQEVRLQDRSSYTYFSITVNPEAFGLTRDELAITLMAENIETRRYYDPPVHRQGAYRQFALDSHLPHADFLSSHILCLPIWSNMDDAIVSGVCQAIERSHSCGHEIKARLDGSLVPAFVE